MLSLRAAIRSERFPEPILQPLQKKLGCGRKNLIFFPDDVQPGFETGVEGAKTELAGLRGIGQFVQCNCITCAGSRHDGRIVEQIVGGGDVQLAEIFSEPLGEGIVR